MNDALKPLLENELLTDENKHQIREAWEKQLKEAREEIEVNLREEFTSRYEHDKGVLIEAVERMVEDGLKAEILEFVSDRKALTEKQVKLAEEIRQARVESKKKLAEQTALLEKFVLERLANELKEFETDRREIREAKRVLAKQLRESRVAYKKQFAERVQVIEEFIIKQLTKEIKEFKADKSALIEQRVRMVEEGKKKIDETRKQFVKRSAKLVEETVVSILNKEMTQLREDIVASRRKHFGMRLFEAFADEFKVTFFNENREIRSLRNKVMESNKKLNEAKGLFDKAQEIARESTKRQKLAESRAERAVILNELLSKLSGRNRDVMAELLEGVKTENLRSSFKKYIPAVTSGTGGTILTRKSVNAPLTENRKIITGDKQSKITEKAEDEATEAATADIIHLQRLAGING